MTIYNVQKQRTAGAYKTIFTTTSKEQAERTMEEYVEADPIAFSKNKHHCNRYRITEQVITEDVVLFDSNDYLDSETEIEEMADWDNLMYDLENTGPVVLTGYFMAWDGKKEGGIISPSAAAAIQKAMLDNSHIIISITNGVLTMDETHHDAPISGNHYTIRKLTKKGLKWLDAHYNLSRREQCETVYNSDIYSENIIIK